MVLATHGVTRLKSSRKDMEAEGTPSRSSSGASSMMAGQELHRIHPHALWDCICEETDNGEYTTLRHATLGIAVELWHDSIGAFHLYVPATGMEARNTAGAVFCCFSSGIMVMEDAVCAPELLLKLCERSRTFANAEYGTLHPSNLEIYNSNNDRSWSIASDGVSRLLSGRKATNTIVISHALTRSEIILFYGGLIFAADEALLPSMSGFHALGQVASLGQVINDAADDDVVEMLIRGRLSRARYALNVSKSAPSDPVQLRGADPLEGFSVSSSWFASDPRAPAPDVQIRQRRHGFQRQRERRSNPASPLPPRFCGAWSKFGKHEGLINVSGYQQQPAGRGVPGPLPSLPGQDGGGRDFMRPFLQKTYLAPGGRRWGLDEQAGGGELQWCRRIAKKTDATDTEMHDLLMSVARQGWADFFDAESPWCLQAPKSAIERAINEVDDSASSPLMVASFHGHYNLAMILLQWGADPNLRNDRGRTCLFHALSPAPRPRPDAHVAASADGAFQEKRAAAASLVELMLRYNADADAADSKGVTPLKLAASSGYHDCASLLLAHGADPGKQDLAGHSVIQTVEAMKNQAKTFQQITRLEQMLGILKEPRKIAHSHRPLRNPGASGNRGRAQSLALIPRRTNTRDAEERAVQVDGDEDAEKGVDGTRGGEKQGPACILAIGGRGAEVCMHRSALCVFWDLIQH